MIDQLCVFSFSCDYKNRSVVIWSISSAYFHSVVNKINATYKKKRKLIKQQEPIYFKLTEIQEADVATYSSHSDHEDEMLLQWSIFWKIDVKF